MTFALSPAFSAAGCGARTDLDAPGGGGGGSAACSETTSGVVTAAIGGGIHHQLTECFARPDGGPCPPLDEAAKDIAPRCFQIDSMDCGPITKPESCCYIVTETCGLT